jgi:protein ImuA
MSESIKSLAALKRHIAALDRTPALTVGCARLATGHAGLDAALDGGLLRGRVHELFGAAEEEGAAAGLALILARLAADDAPLLWLRTTTSARAGGSPYEPGPAADRADGR